MQKQDLESLQTRKMKGLKRRKDETSAEDGSTIDIKKTKETED